MENHEIKEYLERIRSSGIKNIIGFSGGSDLEKVTEIVRDSFENLPKQGIAILTGGTSFGIPKAAYDVARYNGYPTIGVYPTRGRKYALPDLDYAIEVSSRLKDSEWGDETEVYSKLANGLIIIGGGFGTAIEFSHIMKINERKIKNGERPVFIAPLCLSGEKTFADLAYEFPMKKELRLCLPAEKIIENGKLASKFIIDNL